MFEKSTLVVHGRLASRQARLRAARAGAHGTQILTFEQLAERLVGGFLRSIDPEVLREKVAEALLATDLGSLEQIKGLPGFVSAATDTLNRVWRSGISLSARSEEHPRIAAMARLETEVVRRLPIAMLRPCDLVNKAMQRIEHAPRLFGPIQILAITELSPCWRPLLLSLAKTVEAAWSSGPREVPQWLTDSAVRIERSEPETPERRALSCATPYHEVIEAIRWARALVASNEARPEDIAIASASTVEYDEHFLALRADAGLDIHFVHGVPVLSLREGQAAAALADVLIHGLSQGRIRRLNTLVRNQPGLFSALPDGWAKIVPDDAPLLDLASWERVIGRTPASSWPDGRNHSAELLAILRLLDQGAKAAEEAGGRFLNGRALEIWRRARLRGPSEAIDATIASLRIDDGLEGCVRIVWMPAGELAAAPRSFVRLLGLTSRAWPRRISDDRLLSDHIIPMTELNPLPVSLADRRDFQTILATTRTSVTFSHARRDSEGRLLGRSPLIPSGIEEISLRRNRVPQHAMSESDRLLARPEEFRGTAQARSAATCWRNWQRPEITEHDGLVAGGHLVIERILARTQSATSLRRLLRDPLGFVWRYGLRLNAPEEGTQQLKLDSLAFGELLHEVLERTVSRLERESGLARARASEVRHVLNEECTIVGAEWQVERSVPPGMLWALTLQEIFETAIAALTSDESLPGQRSWTEVPFGHPGRVERKDLPWDPEMIVEIPGTRLRINGFIDRLDLSGDRKIARVRDYKSGRPKKDGTVLEGGAELQRCLYGVAVRAMLGPDIRIDAALVFPRNGVSLRLADPDQTLKDLSTYLVDAVDSLSSGYALAGPDTSTPWNDYALALPAGAARRYCARKEPAVRNLLGDAATVWEAA